MMGGMEMENIEVGQHRVGHLFVFVELKKLK
jgi:hypothetical protein